MYLRLNIIQAQLFCPTELIKEPSPFCNHLFVPPPFGQRMQTDPLCLLSEASELYQLTRSTAETLGMKAPVAVACVTFVCCTTLPGVKNKGQCGGRYGFL